MPNFVYRSIYESIIYYFKWSIVTALCTSKHGDERCNFESAEMLQNALPADWGTYITLPDLSLIKGDLLRGKRRGGVPPNKNLLLHHCTVAVPVGGMG